MITLHCPLLPSTRNMIGRAEFARMKPNAILINTARGGLVDEEALAEALERKQIAGAGFDVVTTRAAAGGASLPAPDRARRFHPDAACRLGEPRGDQGLADQLTENIELYAKGAPRHLV